MEFMHFFWYATFGDKMIVKSIVETIGNTPMVDVSRAFNLESRLLVKVESFNPGGSVKDRIAYHMISTAIQEGKVDQDTEIIEPTSGNTGVGIAMVCASLELSCTIVMPESMTPERRQLIQAYGAKLVLTPGELGMKGSIAKAHELAAQAKKAFIPMQFENPANPEIHTKTTVVEILRDTENTVDFFVAGSGTGGTLSGVGQVLKQVNPKVQIIAVEPEASATISQGKAGKHGIYGIGPGFVPKNLNLDVLSEVRTVSDEDAIKHTRLLARKCGILAGVSSGAAFAIALKIAQKPENKGKTVVVVLPDTGERYLSTPAFKEDL